MITIYVELVASELAPGLNSGEYGIEAGASVLDLLRVCESACGAAIPEKNHKNLYLLFNGKPVKLDTALTEDGTLHMCRVVLGG